MSVVEKTIDGVLVRLGPYGRVKLEKTKLLDVAKFKCECGEAELTITKGDVETAGKGPPSTPGFLGVKILRNWVAKKNEAQEKANMAKLDFCEYQEAFRILHAEKRQKSELELMNTYATTLSVDCPVCRRHYSIPLEISNPLEEIPEFNLIECYKKLGFDLNKKKTRQILARVSLRERFEKSENLLKHLEGISAEHDFALEMISALQQALENFIAGKSPPTEDSQAWVRSIQESLKELNEDFSKESEKTLRGHLEVIADWSRTWREVTE